MAGPAEIGPAPSAGAGGFDLLRRATQAMMSKSAAGEEEHPDQIGFDTPRSGVATPQPDLHDKRLPGIMSYFGQVRAPSFTRMLSRTSSANGRDALPPDHILAHTEKPSPAVSPSQESRTVSTTDSVSNASSEVAFPLLPHEMAGMPAGKGPEQAEQVHGYPTPPASHRTSLQHSRSRPHSLRRMSMSDTGKGHLRGASLLMPLASTVEVSSVSAYGVSDAGAGHTSTTSESANQSRRVSRDDDASSFKSAIISNLKKLTDVPPNKSGASTPIRALSSTPPSNIDGQDGARRGSAEGSEVAVTETSSSSGAGGPAAKGKLTIKILEGRGLRKCRDPYVVVVFQRSELISGGPRPDDDSDEAAISAVAMGGIPIQRQGSDSGRPPVSIPMRSRQSSNTSVTDPTNFRNRHTRRSFTNPKWDAEAVFDVVDSEMLVQISVYGLGASGEEFLGQVDFEASAENNGTVRGWFPLKGHADTVAENVPTGELHVDSFFQRAEKKHFGPQDFQILRLIGKGTFGQVYQVRKRDTGRVYAMKVLSKKVIVQKKEVAHTVGERNILVRTAMSESPFIVSLKFSFQTPSDLYLVTDYMSGGELFWHLQKEGRFDEKRAKFYIAELILAIEHLHKNDIVYRDLKPENILLDANGHIALCDFGLSKANLTKNDTTNTFCGTTEYLAPEVLLDEAGYTKMVDFWSLGVLVFEMCCGWSPFYAEDTQQMYKNIAFGKVRFPRDTLSLEGRNFVKGLLNRNPKHRLGAVDDAEELKRHAFFGDIDWNALAKKLITPPFKPQLKSETDVSYFDPEFTNAMNTNGSLNERALALAKGYATSTPLSPSVQANFQGFTFVDESALEDHMRDLDVATHDDEEDQDMDDADRKRDDDWDDLNDLEHRNANRMSGIMKTGTNDEQLFGGTRFDA